MANILYFLCYLHISVPLFYYEINQEQSDFYSIQGP